MSLLLPNPIPEEALKRLDSHTNKNGPIDSKTNTSCWICDYAVSNPRNYPHINIKGTYYLASRISYFHRYGIDPGNLQVQHICCNPDKRCINPEHLKLGDAQDNADDRIDDGNNVGGPNLNNKHGAKITQEIVDEIKLYAYNHPFEPQKRIAKRFNVSYDIVWRILNNKCWK